mmetsp:Transcript_18868/g.61928  ORF Transcript_18868/g.61928 Transcript_18868/m.61928 type:complete len:231 (-) Transcript_18868:679-1371(-)
MSSDLNRTLGLSPSSLPSTYSTCLIACMADIPAHLKEQCRSSPAITHSMPSMPQPQTPHTCASSMSTEEETRLGALHGWAAAGLPAPPLASASTPPPLPRKTPPAPAAVSPSPPSAPGCSSAPSRSVRHLTTGSTRTSGAGRCSRVDDQFYPAPDARWRGCGHGSVSPRCLLSCQCCLCLQHCSLTDTSTLSTRSARTSSPASTWQDCSPPGSPPALAPSSPPPRLAVAC